MVFIGVKQFVLGWKMIVRNEGMSGCAIRSWLGGGAVLIAAVQ